MERLTDEEPVSLAEACRLFFGGRLTPSSLRTEHEKGNLEIIQIARKDFVTRKAVMEMMERCRKKGSRHDSGSEGPQRIDLQHGSSRMESEVTAQDAVRARLRKLNESSPNTSKPNTRRPAEVVPLKSR